MALRTNSPSCLFAAPLILAVALATLRVFAQQPAPTNDDDLALEVSLYGSARPYADDPILDLKKFIPELNELKSNENQSDLPSLLVNAGRRADRLLHDMPDLIATEKVSETFLYGRQAIDRTETFNYLILTHKDAADLRIEEYRTDKDNQRIAPSTDPRAPKSQGFALAWINFHPANQSQSRFRYLGTEKLHGHDCFVVCFAEIPGRVLSPGVVYLGKQPILVLYQGIAWIAETDYSIVQLREDLLAPHPEFGIKKLSTEVEFGEQHVASSIGNMWLPHSAYVEFQQVNASGTEVAQSLERHIYSHYRRYEVQVKINPKSY